MAKKHQKHTALVRPSYGVFHRQEWSIIGAPCGRIMGLAGEIIESLQSEFKLAYVDADHGSADEAEGMVPTGASQIYIDKINFHRYDYAEALNHFQSRPLFEQSEGLLMNGNHFSGQRQIVILDPKKEISLSKKLDRLKDVSLILSTDEQASLYPFLQDHFGDQTLPPILPINDIKAIANWLKEQLIASKAPLYGLVLAGGKSTRMGEDKGLIDYHGQSQRTHLAEMLGELCEQVHYSLHPDQEDDLGDFVIRDTFTGLGPYGAILSAFRENPNAAWLVVACDLPLLDKAALEELIAGRDTSKIGTAFHNPETNWPDPLVTIWEPRSYLALLQFLAQGYSCPRKVLINSDVNVIQSARPEVLMNANSPEERELILKKLKTI